MKQIHKSNDNSKACFVQSNGTKMYISAPELNDNEVNEARSSKHHVSAGAGRRTYPPNPKLSRKSVQTNCL